MVKPLRFVAVNALLSLLSSCPDRLLAEQQTVGPQPKIINATMQGQDYVRLLGGPPDSVSMRSGAVALQPGKTVGKHSTGGYEEVVIVLEGEGAMMLSNGKQLRLRPGFVAYCPPGTEHDVKNTGSGILRYIYVVARATLNGRGHR